MSTITHSSKHRVQGETQESIVTRPVARKVLAVSRVVIGFTFLWAFLDKLFGFGFATPSSRAWINGGPPRGSSRTSKARSTTPSRSSPTRSVTGCSWPASSASASR